MGIVSDFNFRRSAGTHAKTDLNGVVLEVKFNDSDHTRSYSIDMERECVWLASELIRGGYFRLSGDAVNKPYAKTLENFANRTLFWLRRKDPTLGDTTYSTISELFDTSDLWTAKYELANAGREAISIYEEPVTD